MNKSSQHPVLTDIQSRGLSRRVFLRNLFLAAGSVLMASWLTACGSDGGSSELIPGVPRDPGFRSPFAEMGPLRAPDENGVELPKGFTSRIIAVFNEPPIPSQPGFL